MGLDLMIQDKVELEKVIVREVGAAQIFDIHTHIFPGGFRPLSLMGMDELLTYHYLISEYFRYSGLAYDEFFVLSKEKQAKAIWQTLFLEHSPVSEAQRGIITVLTSLGLDTGARSLDAYREYFKRAETNEHVEKVFQLAGVKAAVMTNDPFDPGERKIWEQENVRHPRFYAALRLDTLLNDYETASKTMQAMGYQVSHAFDDVTEAEIRRFLQEWVGKMDVLYMAASLPVTFTVPENSWRGNIIEKCIIPVCREMNKPFAMMIGVERDVNPKLRLAGDSVRKAEICPIEYLCRTYPDNKFMLTMLSRENQHEMAVTARKFRNLMIFGCWWYMNTPSLIEEITTLRIEALGLSFIPQHSDARVLEQLIYKWSHFRTILTKVLVNKYNDIFDSGWHLTEQEIRQDVEALLSANFERFLQA